MAKYNTTEEVISVIETNDIAMINECSRSKIFTIVRQKLYPKQISVNTENHIYDIYEEVKNETYD